VGSVCLLRGHGSGCQIPQVERFHFVAKFNFFAQAGADIWEVMTAAAQAFATSFVLDAMPQGKASMMCGVVAMHFTAFVAAAVTAAFVAAAVTTAFVTARFVAAG